MSGITHRGMGRAEMGFDQVSIRMEQLIRKFRLHTGHGQGSE